MPWQLWDDRHWFFWPSVHLDKQKEVQALIQKRIDRFFVNASWCTLYPDARVVHLTRCHSDHCPVMLDMLPRNHVGKKRPFKFQTCWLKNPTFPRIVSHAWRQPNILVEAIENFTKEAINWNKMHLGNIFAKKRNIKARLNGIQKVIGVRSFAALLELEKSLLRELDTILRQEEELWALKSCVNWLIQGDRNTAYYHVSTLVRRKINQILAIKDNMGEWLHEENEVKEFIGKDLIRYIQLLYPVHLS